MSNFPHDFGLTFSFWEAFFKCLLIFINRESSSPEGPRAMPFALRGRYKLWRQGRVHCSGRGLSLHSLYSSSSTICPDRSQPRAVPPENKALLASMVLGQRWWKVKGTSRGGPGSHLSLFRLQPPLPFPSPLHSVQDVGTSALSLPRPVGWIDQLQVHVPHWIADPQRMRQPVCLQWGILRTPVTAPSSVFNHFQYLYNIFLQGKEINTYGQISHVLRKCTFFKLSYPNIEHLEGNGTTLNDKLESQPAACLPFPRAKYKVPVWDFYDFWLSEGLASDNSPISTP